MLLDSQPKLGTLSLYCIVCIIAAIVTGAIFKLQVGNVRLGSDNRRDPILERSLAGQTLHVHVALLNHPLIDLPSAIFLSF